VTVDARVRKSLRGHFRSKRLTIAQAGGRQGRMIGRACNCTRVEKLWPKTCKERKSSRLTTRDGALGETPGKVERDSWPPKNPSVVPWGTALRQAGGGVPVHTQRGGVKVLAAPLNFTGRITFPFKGLKKRGLPRKSQKRLQHTSVLNRLLRKRDVWGKISYHTINPHDHFPTPKTPFMLGPEAAQ